MFKTLISSMVIFGFACPAFASSSPEDRVKNSIYSALTHVIGFTGQPVVTKTSGGASAKNQPMEMLAEHCFHAGSLQMKIWAMPRMNPSVYQASEPLRSKLFAFIDRSQEALRLVCETNEVTARLTPQARITLVQTRVIDILNAAAELRAGIGIQHAQR